MTCSISLRGSPSPAERALGSVLRRWLKAARITRNNSASSDTAMGFSFRTVSRITEEVTFGCGWKQCGGTSNKSSVSACHWTKSVNAP